MKKAFWKKLIFLAAFTVLSTGGSLFLHSVFAWEEPQSSPPANNTTFGWTDGGTSVYLSTLTDYVGIGLNNPNKQLHVKTSSGNAEVDIQSASQNYWALYHDATTEQLRFWNADFAGDVGAGVGNAFVIDNDGIILAKTPVEGDSNNAVATKGYVDAVVSATAGGGGISLVNGDHNTKQCVEAGGTVIFDGSNPLFCKFSGSNMVCPDSWTQYQNWQSYGGSWDGDACSRHTSSGPISFANATATCKTQGSFRYTIYEQTACGEEWYWSVKNGYWQGAGWQYNIYNVDTTTCSPSANRNAIGCY